MLSVKLLWLSFTSFIMQCGLMPCFKLSCHTFCASEQFVTGSENSIQPVSWRMFHHFTNANKLSRRGQWLKNLWFDKAGWWFSLVSAIQHKFTDIKLCSNSLTCLSKKRQDTRLQDFNSLNLYFFFFQSVICKMYEKCCSLRSQERFTLWTSVKKPTHTHVKYRLQN